MTLKDIRNEQQYFKYIHFCVKGYKKLCDYDIEYFNECLRGHIEEPVLLNVLLSIALQRRKFITSIRDKVDNVDFVGMHSDERYKQIRAKLVKDYPQIEYIPAQALFKGICNSIAHGEVVAAFDFYGFKEMLREGFKVSSIKAIKNSWYKNEDVITTEKLDDFSSLFVDLKYGYKSAGKNNRAPLIYTLKVGLQDIATINNLVADYCEGTKRAVSIPENGAAYEIDLKTRQRVGENIMDAVKNLTYKNILEDFNDFFESEDLDWMDQKFINQFLEEGPKVALSRSCLMTKMLNNRILDLDNVQKTIEIHAQGHKFNIIDLTKNITKKRVKQNSNSYQLASSIYCSKIENLYHELLITEIVSLMERIEATGGLLEELATTEVVKNISSNLYNKDKNFVTQNNCINSLKLLRNSLIHINYIFDPIENVTHFYALKKQNVDDFSQIDKSAIEYRLTLNESVLEELKENCYYLYQDSLKQQVDIMPSESTLNTVVDQTSTIKPKLKK